MTLYKKVDLKEGDLVAFVGNHVTRADEPPKYGFVPVEDNEYDGLWDMIREAEAEIRDLRAALRRARGDDE